MTLFSDAFTLRFPKIFRFIRTVSRIITDILFYFTAQRRLDRRLIAQITPESIAKMKRELAAVRQSKKDSGRILIQHGGTIEAKPFPPRGSLLTEEEKKDPLYRS